MKKKEYIKPEVNVIMMEAEKLLAGSYDATMQRGSNDDEDDWEADSDNKLWVD